MKILFITNGSFPKSFRNFNYYQRAFFFSQYFEMTLLLNKTAYISAEIKPKVSILKSKWKGKQGLFLFCLFNFFSLRKYDIILTEPSSFVIFGYLTKIIFKKKWVIDIWDIPFRDLKLTFFSKLRRKLQVFFFRPIFQKADLNIVSIVPNFQLKEFNLSKEKMRCFHNAIFLDEYRDLPVVKPYEKFTILIQRSQFYKGFGLELMLKAFHFILQEIDANLLIVGQILPTAQEDIDQFQFKEKIITTGFVEHEEFINLALKSHVCAIPFPKIVDLEQTYPIKAIEFMALGKAIVATQLTGLEKTLKDTGILVNPVTPENIAEAIIELYHNPLKRLDLGKRAQKRAKLFNAYDKNQAIYELLQDLVRK